MSLNLDARQRAMLGEMRVPVWAPEPVRAEPASVPAAPEKIAIQQAPTRTLASFDAKAPSETLGERPEGVQAMDWPALQAAVAACTACGLCRSRKNTVFGVGSLKARWLIVGEAPGENEDIAGQPFVGQAGKLLDNMLRAVDLDRTQDGAAGAYITNVLKCRPPANRNPEPQEVAQCAPFLLRQVELLQPAVILALGKFAAQAVLQASMPDVASQPLGKLRGRVYQLGTTPVVVSYHPAYLLRNLPEKAKAWADLCLAADTVKNSGF